MYVYVYEGGGEGGRGMEGGKERERERGERDKDSIVMHTHVSTLLLYCLTVSKISLACTFMYPAYRHICEPLGFV